MSHLGSESGGKSKGTAPWCQTDKEGVGENMVEIKLYRSGVDTVCLRLARSERAQCRADNVGCWRTKSLRGRVAGSSIL
jgi:hypothetical protein